MTRSDDIRKSMLDSCASAVEGSKTSASSCCAGAIREEGGIAGLREAGLADALAGKVASIRVVGRKPREVNP